MFGFSQLKLVIMAVILTVFLSLMGVAKYYHSEYVKVNAKLATTQMVLEATQKIAKDCSDNTDKLLEASKTKALEVSRAQQKASALAKSNRAMATQILTQNSVNPNRCDAALDLIETHKAETKDK